MELSLGNRIKYLRKNILKLSQEIFGESIGVGNSAISQIEKGENKPSKTLLIAISLRYNISMIWLTLGEGEIYHNKQTSSNNLGTSDDELKVLSNEYIAIPLLDGQVTAGPDGGIIYDQIKDRYPFKREWIENKFGTDTNRIKKLVLARISGDSMCPLITSGELVLVDTVDDDRINIKHGRVYLVRMPDGTLVLKRLTLSKINGILKLLLLSDNPAYEPFDFEIPEGRSLTYYILGRVRWIGRELE